MRSVLVVLVLILCTLSLLSAYTSPGAGRRGSGVQLTMSSGEEMGSKANIMLRKKKVKEIDALKAEMASEGDSNPINVSAIVK